MRTQRRVVDYSLQRRALLRAVYAGRVAVNEVCDASPYLKSAARFHGESTDVRCPICRRENLTHVHYIYGDALKQSAGQARARAELPALATTVGEVQVYVVEVCRGCSWNHLVEQFLLGRDGDPVEPVGVGPVGVEPAAAVTGCGVSAPGSLSSRGVAADAPRRRTDSGRRRGGSRR